jgi:hypothetical protein
MLEDRLDLLDHLVELARVLVRISEDLERLRGVTFTAEQRMLGNGILVQLDECLAGARLAFGD